MYDFLLEQLIGKWSKFINSFSPDEVDMEAAKKSANPIRKSIFYARCCNVFISYCCVGNLLSLAQQFAWFVLQKQILGTDWGMLYSADWYSNLLYHKVEGDY